MKIIHLITLILLGGATQGLHAQHYTLSKALLNSGQVTSGAGVYSHQGMLGVYAGLPSASDHYTVSPAMGGMIELLQSPGAPKLSIQRLGLFVRISWEAGGQDFVLEETTALNVATPWSPVDSPYNVEEETTSVTLPIESGNRYFRLRLP